MDSWKSVRSGRKTAAVALGLRLLADFAASGVAGCLGHRLETVTLAGTLPFAGIFSGLAVVHAFAGSYAVAMNSSVSGLYLSGDTGKQSGSSDSQGSTGNGLFDVHFVFLGDQ